MLGGDVFRLVADGLKQLDLDLKRRVGELAQDLGLGGDLRGHEGFSRRSFSGRMSWCIARNSMATKMFCRSRERRLRVSESGMRMGMVKSLSRNCSAYYRARA